jgi:two-component system, LuxR family, response regulator FixJ
MTRDYETVPRARTAVVDDDPDVLDSMKFLLKAAGYDVHAYPTADSFLADEAARPDCLIVDQHMPRMTGLELAAHLREAGAGIPMLLVTGSPSPAIVARAASLGITAVLGKPAEPEALLNFVAAHRRRRTP